ncbi:protein STPG4 [Scyliorhinus canicula]|uniref:protein STPG4 n=1 Tax=Scyliorhinus canicula TaxID=7830 RepID=UPI0018F5C1DD|nr:protein STPG4 [Scyliorhinus canicula]
MAATASNPSAEKIASAKRLTNQSEIKSKVKGASNAKVNRNSKQKRNSLSEVHESSRGRWLRENIKDTPPPGKYPIKDFIEEGLLNPVKRTYNFKAQGRVSTTSSESQSREQLVKHGQNPVTLTEVGKKSSSLQVLKSPTKKKSASQKSTLTATSHNLKTPVFGKSTAKLGKVDFLSSFSQGNFRSSVKRFPTIYFVPKEGPAPGQYNVKHETLSQMMTSSFQSKVPRFLTHPNKTPGPGTYDPIRQTRAATGLYYYQLNT